MCSSACSIQQRKPDHYSFSNGRAICHWTRYFQVFPYPSTFGTGNGNDTGGIFVSGLVFLITGWMEHTMRPTRRLRSKLWAWSTNVTDTQTDRDDRSNTHIHSWMNLRKNSQPYTRQPLSRTFQSMEHRWMARWQKADSSTMCSLHDLSNNGNRTALVFSNGWVIYHWIWHFQVFSSPSTFGTGNGNEAGGILLSDLVCLITRWMEHFMRQTRRSSVQNYGRDLQTLHTDTDSFMNESV
jgi:hypothetical protein